jgi:hypothetical protein
MIRHLSETISPKCLFPEEPFPTNTIHLSGICIIACRMELGSEFRRSGIIKSGLRSWALRFGGVGCVGRRVC